MGNLATWFCSVYIGIAAAFLWTVGSVSVIDSNVYMNHKVSGTWTNYLKMMPLKRAVAFIYDTAVYLDIPFFLYYFVYYPYIV